MGLHLLTQGVTVDYESPGYIPCNASISGSAAPEPRRISREELAWVDLPSSVRSGPKPQLALGSALSPRRHSIRRAERRRSHFAAGLPPPSNRRS